jgi:hypothetical protein
MTVVVSVTSVAVTCDCDCEHGTAYPNPIRLQGVVWIVLINRANIRLGALLVVVISSESSGCVVAAVDMSPNSRAMLLSLPLHRARCERDAAVKQGRRQANGV